MSNPLDLTSVKVSETFPRLVQIDTDGAFYDGLGNPIDLPNIGPTGSTGATGSQGPTGSNGLNGASTCTLYSSGPGGNPIITPGTATLTSINDAVNSNEYFNSSDVGVYFQSILPNITTGNSSYIGLYSYGGGLIYYAYVYYSGGPYIKVYKQSTVIAEGNYIAGDLFSIYLDGINANYTIGPGTYTSEQSINARFACTVSLGSYSGTPIQFQQFLYYPTGKKGINGVTGPTGPGGTGTLSGTVNKIVKFNTTTSGADSSLTDDGSLVTVDNDTQINGLLYLNSNIENNISSNSTIATVPKTNGSSAFFDYYITDGTSLRCGTVMSVWDSSGNTKYTDTSSGDLNGSTEGLSFTVETYLTDIILVANITAGTWTIKTSTRVL
jgi:hypothetical protein